MDGTNRDCPAKNTRTNRGTPKVQEGENISDSQDTNSSITPKKTTSKRTSTPLQSKIPKPSPKSGKTNDGRNKAKKKLKECSSKDIRDFITVDQTKSSQEDNKTIEKHSTVTTTLYELSSPQSVTSGSYYSVCSLSEGGATNNNANTPLSETTMESAGTTMESISTKDNAPDQTNKKQIITNLNREKETIISEVDLQKSTPIENCVVNNSTDITNNTSEEQDTTIKTQQLENVVPDEMGTLGGSLAVVRSYTLGCEPLVTGNLAMGLTIRSSHKQELSSVYQFIDVLYSLCIYEALRHLSLSCSLSVRLFVFWFSSLSVLVLVLCALYLCRAIYTKLAAL